MLTVHPHRALHFILDEVVSQGKSLVVVSSRIFAWEKSSVSNEVGPIRWLYPVSCEGKL